MMNHTGAARRFGFEDGPGRADGADPSDGERIARLRARANGAPRDASAQAALGLALLDAGQSAEGKTYLARAVTFDPNQSLARRKLEAVATAREIEDMHLPPPIVPMGSDLAGVLLFPWRTSAKYVIFGSGLLFAVAWFVSCCAPGFLGLIAMVFLLGLVIGVSFGYAVRVCRYAGTGRLDAPQVQDVTDFFEAVRDLVRALILTVALMVPSVAVALLLDLPEETLKPVVYGNILAGLFVWPMGFLVLALIPAGFDFLRPTILLPAIARTFGSYLKIVLLTLGLLWALDAAIGFLWEHVELALASFGFWGGLAAVAAAWGLHFYVLLVFAHAMGRFYRENEQRLGWFTREALRGG